MSVYALLFALIAATLGLLLLPVLKASEISQGRRIGFASIVSLLFLSGGFTLYQHFGTSGILPLLAEREQTLAALKLHILKRSEEVKNDPKNLTAWVSLGQSFIETGQYDAAANAFRRAVVLSGGNPVLILAYAKSLIIEEGKVGDQAQKSLKMVLLQQPDNAEAKYFLALRELQDGHTQAAMQQMKALYHSLPEGSELKIRIDRQIGRQ